ncbi:MAG: hypothetical protein AB7E47_10760 [Desulfovibrionaceae bacterium]
MWAEGLLPPPVPLPGGLAARCAASLAARRTGLEQERHALESAIAAHEAHCAQVPATDAARIESCRASQARAEADAMAYMDAIAAFERALGQAMALAEAERDMARLADEADAARQRLASAKAEMTRINARLASYQQQMGDWFALADKARSEAVDTAISATIDVVATRVLETGLKASASTFHRVSARLRSVEQRLALRDQDRFEAILAAARKSKEASSDTASLLVLIKALKNGIGLFYATGDAQHGKDREEVLRGLLDTASLLGRLAYPGIGYLTADAKILAALAGGWYSYAVAKKNILTLLELSETDLRLTAAATERVLTLTKASLDLESRHQRAQTRRDVLPPPPCP